MRVRFRRSGEHVCWQFTVDTANHRIVNLLPKCYRVFNYVAHVEDYKGKQAWMFHRVFTLPGVTL